MRLSALRELCERNPAEGPVATVYLDRVEPDESTASRTALRARALSDGLAEQGADRRTVATVDSAVTDQLDRHDPTAGHLLVAEPDAVLADLPLLTPGSGDLARWAPLPHLERYVRTQSEPLPYALVTVDRIGADIAVYGEPVSASGTLTNAPGTAGPRAQAATVEGDDHPVHKIRGGGWSQYRYQRRVETQWQHNAAVAADAVAETIRAEGLDLVILAGDVRARSLLLDQLPGTARATVVEVEPGGRADGTDDETLRASVQQVLERRRAEWLDTLADRIRRGRGGGSDQRSAEGVSAVLDALHVGQVETLVLADREPAVATLLAGAGAAEVAESADDLPGVDASSLTPASWTDGLIRAGVGTSAHVAAMPPDVLDLVDGVGAVLRYA